MKHHLWRGCLKRVFRAGGGMGGEGWFERSLEKVTKGILVD